MKRKVSLFLLAVLVLSLFAPVSFAADTDPGTGGGSSGGIQVLAEEIQVNYMTFSGVLHYRIWSVSYGYWKTDWTPVSKP